jgi:hypothetical protein
MTSELLPSKNTSGVYGSHSEWINSSWTKGRNEKVNRLCLGLRCWTHCGRHRNPSCTYRTQSVSESAIFLWLCYLHSVYLWVFICETRDYVPYKVRCAEESVTTSVRDILERAWIWIRVPSNVIGIEQTTTAPGRWWRYSWLDRIIGFIKENTEHLPVSNMDQQWLQYTQMLIHQNQNTGKSHTVCLFTKFVEEIHIF